MYINADCRYSGLPSTHSTQNASTVQLGVSQNIYNNNNNNNNNNNIYELQLGCHPVAVVILRVNKT